MQKLLTSFTMLCSESPLSHPCLSDGSSFGTPTRGHTLVGAGALQRAILLRLRVSPSVTDPIDSYYLYRLKLYALAVKKHVDLYASRLEVEHTITYWPWTPEARRFSKAVPDTMCKLLPA